VSGLANYGFAAGWRIVRALPAPVARGLFRLGADLAVRRGGGGIDRLAGNLRRVVGPELPDAELRELVRAGVRSYARYWMEAFRLPSLSRHTVVGTLDMAGEHLLRDAHAAGRGLIVALPHAGNWDHAGAWVCLTGMPLTTVAERLKPEDLYKRFLAYRESLGMEILPTKGGERPALDVLADRLREGKLVVLLADRDLSSRGVPVEFFGSPTRMPPGPAMLALRTGAPLFVASLWYEDGRSKVKVVGPVAVPTEGNQLQQIAAMTQDVADRLAEGIAAHPADWHMLQRLWLDDARGGAGQASADAPTSR
jgi:KDO2-lipid IV(A) lauroyltransferase